MRIVRFRKTLRKPFLNKSDAFNRSQITVTLETDDLDSMAHEAMDYLEAAIKALPEKIGEPAVVEHIYGLCEGCEGRADGYVCPAKSYIEIEVLDE